MPDHKGVCPARRVPPLPPARLALIAAAENGVEDPATALPKALIYAVLELADATWLGTGQ